MNLASAAAGLLLLQQIQFDSPRPTHQQVTLVDDSLTVASARPQDVELRFRVEPGMHINSHTPKDELLLPTTLKLDPAPVQLLSEDYPAGKPFHLAIGAGETLDVYQAEFRIHLRIFAPAGSAVLTGTLRYQACDTASCYPPKTLPVKVAITAR
jgi:hypothetical protein